MIPTLAVLNGIAFLAIGLDKRLAERRIDAGAAGGRRLVLAHGKRT
mgnify:CR=1 FL=1